MYRKPSENENEDGGFVKMPNSKHGNGSPRAANKGKVKRALKASRVYKKRRRS